MFEYAQIKSFAASKKCVLADPRGAFTKTLIKLAATIFTQEYMLKANIAALLAR